MNQSKNHAKIANKLEVIAYRNINKAIKKYVGDVKVTSFHDKTLIDLNTSLMSDNDHMLYACAYETLSIIFDNGEECA